MIQNFDFFDLPEIPSIVLCNPDKTEIHSLGTIFDRQLSLRYNALSTFSFTAPSEIEGVTTPYYSSLTYRRLISIENLGYFMITEINEDADGMISTKRITAQSLEVEFLDKKVSSLEGTYKFYDLILPEPTLLGKIINLSPGWTIGTVAGSLLNKYRSFDVSDSTVYGLLMTEISQAYQCIFEFDTTNKTISAVSADQDATETDIFIGFNNIMETIDIKTITEEQVTALNVFGGGDLDIRTVNPLGTNTIYNFDAFKSTAWMSASLVAVITAWEDLVDTNQSTYATLLTTLKDYNETLREQQADLVVLQADRAALKGVQKAKIEQGLSISATNTQIKAKDVQIAAKKAAIAITQANIVATTASLTAINDALSFESNFTEAQIVELDAFIVGGTYQNENFIQTDLLTNAEIQDIAQELYDQAQFVLTKVAQARYEFSIEAINFIFLKEFETFKDQAELGVSVTLEIEKDVFITPVLLGMDLNYDNPADFKLIFSNRFRLDDSSFVLADLLGENSKSAVSTNFNSRIWKNWDDTYKDPVSTFITSALDASVNNVVSSTNNEMTMDQNGLQGKKLLADGTYDPRQVWLTPNLLVFTEDNWDTASTAVGQISTSSGSAYGIVGNVIVGRLLASTELVITNEGNNFFLNENGAVLTNASFTLNTDNGRNQIVLNPEDGIKIRQKIGSNWVDKFYVDSSGNVVFSGNLSGATGTFTGTISAAVGNIGGWTINSRGLKDSRGNYIYSDGNIRLGALYINGNTAIFSGKIYADNLKGEIGTSQVADGAITNDKVSAAGISADKITAGTLSADRIYGGTIRWPGVTMGISSLGYSEIRAEKYLNLLVRDLSSIGLQANRIYLTNDKEIFIGSNSGGTDITLNGPLYTNGQQGISRIVSTSTLTDQQILNFTNGILTSVTPASAIPVP